VGVGLCFLFSVSCSFRLFYLIVLIRYVDTFYIFCFAFLYSKHVIIIGILVFVNIIIINFVIIDTTYCKYLIRWYTWTI
jgi:hypothetical protein